MAVFRIDKTRDYTVMSNHHLRNTELSLKAKGLLSLMLSLPENWDYTTKGLAAICKDGIDSISSCIRELEKHGYIIRERMRNEKGQLTTIEYTILEQPKSEPLEREKPIRENPVLDIPAQAEPIQENTAQLNTNKSNIKELNTDISNTYPIKSYQKEPAPAQPTKEKSDIRNIKKYLLAALFNAPSTIDSYYTTKVHHDMAQGI